MSKDLSPKDKIKNIIQLRYNNRIEESWDNIRLYWAESSESIITAIFGKRSVLYYKCPPALNCMCFHAVTRSLTLYRTFGLGDIEFNEMAKTIFDENGWNNLIDGEKFENAGETVVTEETDEKILFYFALNLKDKANIAFNIENDKYVKCDSKRVCAKEEGGRVIYTTFLKTIPKKPSPLLSKFPTKKN